MFSMACVSHSVHRGGGDMHDWGVLLGVGVCMAGGVCGLGVHDWGARMAEGGVRG